MFQMLVGKYLIYLVGIFVTVTVESRNPRTVNRKHYGVIFKDAGTVVLSSNYWRHTFEVRLPEVPDRILSKVTCDIFKSRAKTVCASHNKLVVEFNKLTKRMTSKLQSVKKTIEGLAGPKLPFDQKSKTKNLGKSRSSRSLLPFIGDLGSSLFGFATEGQINTLARHVQEIMDVQASGDRISHHNTEELRAFMKGSNKRIDQLKFMIDSDHETITRIGENLVYHANNLAVIAEDIASVLPMLINNTAILLEIERNLDSLVQGMHELLQRKLPPSLVPAEALHEAFQVTEKGLHMQYPAWGIVFKQVNYFYSQRDLVYAFHNNSIFIVIIPDKQRMFRILSLSG